MTHVLQKPILSWIPGVSRTRWPLPAAKTDWGLWMAPSLNTTFRGDSGAPRKSERLALGGINTWIFFNTKIRRSGTIWDIHGIQNVWYGDWRDIYGMFMEYWCDMVWRIPGWIAKFQDSRHSFLKVKRCEKKWDTPRYLPSSAQTLRGGVICLIMFNTGWCPRSESLTWFINPKLLGLWYLEYILLLVGGFKHVFIFHNVWDNPSHWLSYFSRWLKPSSHWIEGKSAGNHGFYH